MSNWRNNKRVETKVNTSQAWGFWQCIENWPKWSEVFTWHHSERVETNASATQVWAVWQNIENWPEWDKELEWVKNEKGMVVGSIGYMKPKKGPKTKFEITNVEYKKRFDDVSKLPLAKLLFTHKYINNKNNAAYIEHCVTITGITAPIFGFFIGRNIKAHLRYSIEKLSEMAKAIKSMT